MSIKQIIYEIIYFLVGVNLFFTFLFFPSQIPSGSMIPTFLPGDYVIVSSVHYGGRTPSAPFAIPAPFASEGKIQFTNIPSYLTWIQLPMCRVPGFSTIKKGHCVVFNSPTEKDKPVEKRTLLIKRCVAEPGEEVEIIKGDVFVNGEASLPHLVLQHRYYIATRRSLPDHFFERHQIIQYQPAVQGGYYAHMTPKTADAIRELPFIKDVVRIIKPQPKKQKISVNNPSFAERMGGNKHHIRRFTVPAKGMQIKMTPKTLLCYIGFIRHCERGKEVKIENGKLFINGKRVETYTCPQNAYFVMGDNRDNSEDSCIFGFVCEDYIVGKATIVVFNGKDPNAHPFFNLLTGNIRTNRFFRKV